MNSVSQNPSLYKILSSLHNVKPCGNGWQALCPAHDDKNPSLHISQAADGRILLKCFAGCETEDIVRAIGLEMGDLFPGHHKNPPRKQRQVVATYNYTNENGVLLFQVCRTEPKGFFQRRPDGRGGWNNGLGDVKPVPYRLPEVIEAVQRGETVFIAEGEKDVDNLARLGLTATTCPMGAGKWRDYYSDWLAGANVVILPDNNDPGRKHAQQVAQSLYGKAASVKVLELPGLPAKGDVSDWLEAGHTKEELLKLVESAKEWEPERPAGCFTAQELLSMEFPDPVWVVPNLNLLPEGLTLLAGKPKIGKSWMALNLAVAVACGGRFLGESVEPAPVLYLALEDTARRLKDRLLSVLNGDPAPDKLYLYTQWAKLDDGGLTLLEAEIERRKPKLVIVDTLQKIRPVHKGNSSIYGIDYEEMSLLKYVADKYGIALVVVHHLKKASEVDPLDMVSGSTGLSGAADAVWVLTRERGQADATLYATGRDFEERELALQFDPMTTSWQLLGTAEEYRMSKERREILEVLKEADAPLSPREVAELVGKRYGTVAKTLQRMVKDGVIAKDGRGKYHTLSPNCPNSPLSPNCPNVQMDSTGGESGQFGQGNGHPNDPQTRINTGFGQFGHFGHMDSKSNRVTKLPELPKKIFGGKLVPGPPGACPTCGNADWWISRYGRKVCRTCHPPAPGAEAKA